MKLIKWLFLILGTVIVLVVAAGIALPLLIDPNDYREKIAAQATSALGREVKLDGPLAWSVFPWVAIELRDVSIANEQGFSAPHLLSVDEASVRVRLAPLLTGKIRVGDVILRAPDVNLEVSGNGRSNWESLTSAADADPGPNADSGDSEAGADLDLNVAGIQLLGGRVSYADAQSDLKASISDFNLTSGAIDASGPLNLDLSMQVAVEGQLDARVQSSLEGSGLLDSSPMTLSVARLSVEGSAMVGDADRLPLSLSLTEPLTYTEADDALSARGIVLESGDAKVTLSVTGSNVSGAQQVLDGQLEVAPFNLRRWLEQSMGAAFQSADPAALENFASQFSFQVRSNSAALKSMQITLDDTAITGSADVSDIERLAGQFQIQIDAIDVDRYLPEGESSSAPSADSEPVNLADLDLGQMRGEIGIASLKVAGVSASDVTLRLTSGPNGVVLEPMNAGLYGGLLDTQVQLQTDGDGRLILKQQISDVQAGPLLTDFLGTQYLTGNGNLNADLTMDDPLGANPLAGANGSIDFEFTDGAIFGMDIFGALNRALALLDKTSSDGEARSAEGQTTFSSMTLSAEVTNGILKTRKLSILSPVLTVEGDLEINLADMSVKGEIEPVLLDATGLSGMDRLAGKKIPLSLSGDLSAPGISIDVGKLLLASQQDRIDRKKDELLNKLLGGDSDDDGDDSDQDESSDKDRAKRQLLKSLLGDDDDDGN